MATNIWRFFYKDNTGGEGKMVMRGPENEPELRKMATKLLNCMRLTAVRSGAPDPGLEVTKVEAIGADDKTQLGEWRPSGAKPVDLGKYANKSAEPTAII